MTATGIALTYILIGLIALHDRPEIIDRSRGLDSAVPSILKLAASWPYWFRRP